MQKCHPAQETLINETCALPKFLCRDCHFYERIRSSLCGIAASSTFCCTCRIISQSTSRSANFHSAKATPALNINCVRSQFRKRHRFLVSRARIFLSFPQDLGDGHLVVRLCGKLLIYRFHCFASQNAEQNFSISRMWILKCIKNTLFLFDRTFPTALKFKFSINQSGDFK